MRTRRTQKTEREKAETTMTGKMETKRGKANDEGKFIYNFETMTRK